ncbi:MAG TPA: response regulator FixJ [Phenylobacterium sp.]|jgi:two-component system response regulator FixJ|uniref:response regulator FixJ n=1 Tax=Phenylobacterium sp. TaxID=1871053 RepID=UPI002D44D570|nr:response regulator FixJ [Phenylobacterium sp.]HZZ69066.1 response regulator FixJ [Phenylobacterium sp.]
MANSSEVYVIDDDEAIRRSLAFLLRTAGLPSRSFDSAEAFLAEAGDLAPGCVITDVRMPGIDGLELVRRVAEAQLPLTTIVITGHGDIALAVEAMKGGAVDFLEKPFKDEVLLAAVQRALDADSRASQQDEDKQRYQAAFAALSRREREVLEQVVVGKTSKVIAYDLGISPRTVEVYRAGMMMKTGAKSLSELVRMALRAGL